MVMEKFSINCCVGCMKLQAHIVYQWHRNTHTHTLCINVNFLALIKSAVMEPLGETG